MRFGRPADHVFVDFWFVWATFFNKNLAEKARRISNTFFLDFGSELGRPDTQSDRAGSIQTRVGTFLIIYVFDQILLHLGLHNGIHFHDVGVHFSTQNLEPVLYRLFIDLGCLWDSIFGPLGSLFGVFFQGLKKVNNHFFLAPESEPSAAHPGRGGNLVRTRDLLCAHKRALVSSVHTRDLVCTIGSPVFQYDFTVIYYHFIIISL